MLMQHNPFLSKKDGLHWGSQELDQLNFQLDSSYLRDLKRPIGPRRHWNSLKYFINDYISFTKTWLSRLAVWPKQQWHARRYQQNTILREQLIAGEIQEKLSAIRRRLFFARIDDETLENVGVGRRDRNVKSAGFFQLGGMISPLIQGRATPQLRSTYPNLKRSMSVSGPEQLWIAEITFMHTKDGKRYFHIITDAYTHQVMGYSISRELTASSAVRALKMALGSRKYYHDLVHHSKKGIHYCLHQYVKLLKESGVKLSASEF